MRENIVLHKYVKMGKSVFDDVCIICVEENLFVKGCYSVYEVVGRHIRDSRVGKVWSADTIMKAVEFQKNALDWRLSKGYQDIESLPYLQWALTNIQNSLWMGHKDISSRLVKGLIRVDDSEFFEVTCINNEGYEGLFDVGITYMSKLHNMYGMLWVYDKYGHLSEYSSKRFKEMV